MAGHAGEAIPIRRVVGVEAGEAADQAVAAREHCVEPPQTNLEAVVIDLYRGRSRGGPELQVFWWRALSARREVEAEAHGQALALTLVLDDAREVSAEDAPAEVGAAAQAGGRRCPPIDGLEPVEVEPFHLDPSNSGLDLKARYRMRRIRPRPNLPHDVLETPWVLVGPRKGEGRQRARTPLRAGSLPWGCGAFNQRFPPDEHIAGSEINPRHLDLSAFPARRQAPLAKGPDLAHRWLSIAGPVHLEPIPSTREAPTDCAMADCPPLTRRRDDALDVDLPPPEGQQLLTSRLRDPPPTALRATFRPAAALQLPKMVLHLEGRQRRSATQTPLTFEEGDLTCGPLDQQQSQQARRPLIHRQSIAPRHPWASQEANRRGAASLVFLELSVPRFSDLTASRLVGALQQQVDPGGDRAS